MRTFPLHRLILTSLLTLGLVLPVAAKSYSFDKEKCVCEIPDDWHLKDDPDELVFAQSPDNTKAFLIRAVACGKTVTLTDPVFIKAFEGKVLSDGLTITKRENVVFHDVTFYSLATVKDFGKGPVYGRTYVTLANGYAYAINVSRFGADPADDNESQALIASFDFIGTPEIHKGGNFIENLFSGPNWDGKNPGYKIGYMIGVIISLLLMLACPLLILVGIGVGIYFLVRKKPSASLPQAPPTYFPPPPPPAA